MAVYKRGYQRYQGEVAGRWTRFMVLPRFAWRRLFQQRQVIILTMFALVWSLSFAVFVYLSNNAELLTTFAGNFKEFIQVNGNFFMAFMSSQSMFAIFLAALTGPGMIAPDLANNALQLYFSRPLTRVDYALARLVTLFALLSCITWIPGLLVFGMQVGMAGGGWFSSNWRLGAGMVAGLAMWTLIVSLVAMASSAYAKLRSVSGGLVLAFFFVMGGAAQIINNVFRVTWGNAVSPRWAARRVWSALLGVVPENGPGAIASVAVLAVLAVLLAVVIGRKLRPVEVIS